MRKNRHNRREFLGLTGVGMAGIAGGTFLGSAVSVEAQAATKGVGKPQSQDNDHER